MATADELKKRIDLHDLAQRLGLERPHGENYRSPRREDKAPSLSIYQDGKRWKDHGGPDGAGGSCIDLVMYVLEMEAGDAMAWLHDTYGIERTQRNDGPPVRRQLTRAEWIADRCLGRDMEPAIEYLEGRAIPREIIERAIKARTLGYNDYRSEKIEPGQPRHGGPAVAYVVYRPYTREVSAVGMRFFDPELNGGIKTQTQGEKKGLLWALDWGRVERAKTIYVTSGECDALSVEACDMPYTAAVACLGDSNDVDWSCLKGKRVVICPDADKPDQHNRCSGLEWAWAVHDALTSLHVAAHMVDIASWYEAEVKDVNEYLQQLGLEELRMALKRLEEWLIGGMPGNDRPGRPRVYLPGHDYAQYWRFRHKEDFLRYIKRAGEEAEDGEGKAPEYMDVAGFRPVAISRVTVQSAAATMTGRPDAQPTTMFSCSVQTPRHGPELQRKVLEDERLHSLQQWQKFGPIWAPAQFQRAINMLERGSHIGSRHAVNYVGLAWKQGKPVANEGPDTYFTDPPRQCPYHSLQFPRTSRRQARPVLDAWRRLFRDDAGARVLVWSIGAHLKAYLGYWPHLVLQADKSAGKSTLLHLLTGSASVQVFSGQSLQTEFRLLTSLSHTSHPVAWEEISARGQRVITTAVSLLQESYQHTETRRGAELTEYLVSAPVLLAGEDVPVRSLTGKVIQVGLTGKKGDLLPRNTPAFPVYEWLQFLAAEDPDSVLDRHNRSVAWCERHCRATSADDGASRMVRNYAALLTAWSLVCEFVGIEAPDMDFAHAVAAEMNEHIRETTGDREPWVWILELMLGQIASHQYRHPYAFRDYVSGGQTRRCLVIRHSDIMQHIAASPGLRDIYDALPVKSPRVLKRQLSQAGVIYTDRADVYINGTRHYHMLALDLERMDEYGLHAAVPEDVETDLNGPDPVADTAAGTDRPTTH